MNGDINLNMPFIHKLNEKKNGNKTLEKKENSNSGLYDIASHSYHSTLICITLYFYTRW